MVFGKFATIIGKWFDEKTESGSTIKDSFNIKSISTAECMTIKPFDDYEECVVITNSFIVDRIEDAKNLASEEENIQKLEWEKLQKLSNVWENSVIDVINSNWKNESEIKDLEIVFKVNRIICIGINKK